MPSLIVVCVLLWHIVYTCCCLLKECVQDIDRALNENQPSLRQLKLLARKGKALIELAMFPEAVQALEKSLNMGSNMSEEFKRS